MLRAAGRKIGELKIRMRNFAERGIVRSILSSRANTPVKSSADAPVNHSSAAQANLARTQTTRSQRDFLILGRRISACVCDGRA